MLIKALEEYIPTPVRDKNKTPLMYIARSFDINKPGARPNELKGGVIGGSIIQGILRKGDEIEIAPGRKIEVEGRQQLERIKTKIETLITGGKTVNEADPGGLIAIGTGLDPARTKSDSFSGKVVGKPEAL